ncbi:hypothetical protein [Algoriphagus sp.]|uniref:hypothetical protein n=1 Tax=Algoriphagus sp. TaxID=1872435 RepID=UPI00391D26AC
MLNKNSSIREKESYIDKLAKLVNPELEKELEFSPEMSPEDVARIMSERIFKVIKIQFEETKKKLETTA